MAVQLLLGILCGDTREDKQHDGENIFQLHVSNAHTKINGDKGDISILCRFKLLLLILATSL